MSEGKRIEWIRVRRDRGKEGEVQSEEDGGNEKGLEEIGFTGSLKTLGSSPPKQPKHHHPRKHTRREGRQTRARMGPARYEWPWASDGREALSAHSSTLSSVGRYSA